MAVLMAAIRKSIPGGGSEGVPDAIGASTRICGLCGSKATLHRWVVNPATGARANVCTREHGEQLVSAASKPLHSTRLVYKESHEENRGEQGDKVQTRYISPRNRSSPTTPPRTPYQTGIVHEGQKQHGMAWGQQQEDARAGEPVSDQYRKGHTTTKPAGLIKPDRDIYLVVREEARRRLPGLAAWCETPHGQSEQGREAFRYLVAKEIGMAFVLQVRHCLKYLVDDPSPNPSSPCAHPNKLTDKLSHKSPPSHTHPTVPRHLPPGAHTLQRRRLPIAPSPGRRAGVPSRLRARDNGDGGAKGVGHGKSRQHFRDNN